MLRTNYTPAAEYGGFCDNASSLRWCGVHNVLLSLYGECLYAFRPPLEFCPSPYSSTSIVEEAKEGLSGIKNRREKREDGVDGGATSGSSKSLVSSKSQLPSSLRSPQLLLGLHYVTDDEDDANHTFLKEQGDGILVFDVSPDGKWVVTSGRSMILRSYAFSSNYDLHAATAVNGMGSRVGRHETLLESKKAENSSNLGKAAEFATFSIEQVNSWMGHNRSTLCLAFDSTSNFIAAGSVDGVLKVYRLRDGQCTHVLSPHASKICLLKFHPKRLILLSSSDDGEIRLWDLVMRCCLAVCEDHLSPISSVAFISSKTTIPHALGALVTASRDSVVNVWNISVSSSPPPSLSKQKTSSLAGVDGYAYDEDVLQTLKRESDEMSRLLQSNSGELKIFHAKEKEDNPQLEQEETATSKARNRRFDKNRSSSSSGFITKKLLPIQQILTSEAVEGVLCLPFEFVDEEVSRGYDLRGKVHALDSNYRFFSGGKMKNVKEEGGMQRKSEIQKMQEKKKRKILMKESASENEKLPFENAVSSVDSRNVEKVNESEYSSFEDESVEAGKSSRKTSGDSSVKEETKKNADKPSWVILTVGKSGSLKVWNPVNRKILKTIHLTHGSGGSIMMLSQICEDVLITVGVDCCLKFLRLPDFHVEMQMLCRIDDVSSLVCLPRWLEEFQLTHTPKKKGILYVPHSEDSRSFQSRVFEAEEVSSSVGGGVWRGEEAKGKGEEYSRPEDRVVEPSCVLLVGDERAYVMRMRYPFDVDPLIGHTDVVFCCDVSPTAWIATGSKDGTVRLWSALTHACVGKFSGHSGAVSAVSLSKKIFRVSDEKFGRKVIFTGAEVPIVSAGSDNSIKVWFPPRNISLLEEGDGGSCSDKPEASSLVGMKSSDGKKRSFNAENRAETAFFNVERSYRSIAAHLKNINDVTLSPDLQLVASAGSDKLVKLWNFPACTSYGVCKGHEKGVWTVRFSPTEKVLMSASADETVRIWNVKDCSCLKTFQGHTSSVLHAVYTPTGDQIISCSADQFIKLWNVRSGECMNTFEKHNEKVWSVDVSEGYLLTGGADGRIVIWKDMTESDLKQQEDANAQTVVEDTQLGNLIQMGYYIEALTLSLKLKRPMQSKQLIEKLSERILEEMLEEQRKHSSSSSKSRRSTSSEFADKLWNSLISSGSSDGDVRASSVENLGGFEGVTEKLEKLNLFSWLDALPMELFTTLLKYLTSWNSSGKFCWLASSLFYLIIKNSRSDRLYAVEGLNSLASSFIAYSAKHEERLQLLIQKSFLLDLLLLGSTATLHEEGKAKRKPGLSEEKEAAHTHEKSQHTHIQRASHASNRQLSYSYLLQDEEVEE